MNAPRDMPLLAAAAAPGMDVVGAPYLSVFCDDHAIPDTTMAGIYAKAKTQQWNAATDIDWQAELDPDNPLDMPDGTVVLYGSRIWDAMGEADRVRVRQHVQSWNLSQILHGEQAAMMCAAKLVQTSDELDVKLCSAVQATDEARHVEVFSRLLGGHFDVDYPVSKSMRALLRDTLSDSRPDITSLGMQILVEGIALSIFQSIRGYSRSDYVKDIFSRVLRDEARHFGAGQVSLRNFYAGLGGAEKAEREEFICESAVRLHDHLCADDIWEPIGMSRRECGELVRSSAVAQSLRRSLFRRLVPSVRDLGLMGPRVRAVFEELGVLAYAEFPVG